MVFTIVQVSNGLQIGAASSVVVIIRDNDNIPVFTPPALFINELNAFNLDYPDQNNQLDDWIELYNAGSEDVNLAGFTITNNIQNPTLFTFPNVPSQLGIPAGGFKIIWADQNTIQGPDHLNFTLNPNGGFLGLFGPEGDVLIDAVEYPGTDSLTNYGRFPDGGAEWQNIYFPTPGAANNDSIPVEDTTSLFSPIVESSLFSVYPNPARDFIQIVKTGNAFQENPEIKILDASGRFISIEFNQQIMGKAWFASTSGLSKGIYLLQIRNKTEISNLRFVKAN